MSDELVHLPALFAETFGVSRSEARRHLCQGSAKINGKQVELSEQDVLPDRVDGSTISLGSRRSAKINL